MLTPQTYAGNPLDRADQLRRDAGAIADALRHPGARFLLFDDELKAPMSADGVTIQWQDRAQAGTGEPILLGLDAAGIPYFAIADALRATGGLALDVRQIGLALGPDPQCAILAQARALVDWHRRHRFCARCGGATGMVRAGYGRHCPSCAAEHFPRVDPVVIMLALCGDRALIGRQAGFAPSMYSALAGFVEPGETLEEAVARELYEEAGVRATSVRYLGCQPWPFPSSLMLGAFAEVVDMDALKIDPHEIEDARWVSRDECRRALRGEADWNAPPPFAIAHALLAYWAGSAE
jgi:NAD+ diphosphatase